MKKMKQCAWCGRLYRQNRAKHDYCSAACRESALTSAKQKPIPAELSCPHNEHLICKVHSCSKCGWHPIVAKQRLAAIIAKMKEGTNGQA